jgi:elongation factor Ts
MNQKFVKNPDQTIEQLVKDVSKKAGSDIVVKAFHKLNLGEGIEKKEDNLADEVAKMTGKQ